MSVADRLPPWLNQSISTNRTVGRSSGWKQIARVVVSFLFIAAGVVAVGWGLARLIEFSQTPVCWQTMAQADRTPQQVKVELSGQVNSPGVYQLDPEDRLARAVELAGGLTPQAASEYVARRLNLASRVEDGQKIYIPSQAELAPSPQPTVTLAPPISNQEAQPNLDFTVSQPAVAGWIDQLQTNDQLVTKEGSGLISLNQASQAELEELPGIGPKRGAAIIENRPFSKVEQLLDLKLVPQSVYQEIESLISL
ncbi:MAG: hypothetical protein GF381_00430 [Candidatus Pacebacteria bacterium]|nr:hypothetical protein [Candidatus Paceibacterota bacterium]